MAKIICRTGMYFFIWFVIESCFKLNYPSTSWATIFVGFEAAFIGLTQLRNTRDKLEISLFMQFNERYSKLNELIKEQLDNQPPESKKGIDKQGQILQNKALEDYINLCCEEYYCYRIKKEIPYHIWKFWHAGIRYNWNNCSSLRKLWEREYDNANSFYINDGDYPFEIKAIKKNKNRFLFCFEKVENFFY